MLFSMLTQRPRPVEFHNISPEIFSPILQSLTTEKVADKDEVNKIFDVLFEGGGGFRDDPKRTRGLDDDYSYYFRRIKNIRTDLEIKRDFSKP